MFRASQRYALRTQTVSITRKVSRPNAFNGEDEDLEYSGQELAFFIRDEFETEYCFMDAKLRDDPNTNIPFAKQVKDHKNERNAVDFTLQELCAHFNIPEVPDVATVDPQGYNDCLDQLRALEQLTESP